MEKAQHRLDFFDSLRRRKAPTMQYEHFSIKIPGYNVETWCIWQRCYISRPIRFCSKICHVGGRILSVILWCDRPRRSLDFDSLRGAPPLHGCTASYMVRNLWTVNRRRNAPTMAPPAKRMVSAPFDKLRHGIVQHRHPAHMAFHKEFLRKPKCPTNLLFFVI